MLDVAPDARSGMVYTLGVGAGLFSLHGEAIVPRTAGVPPALTEVRDSISVSALAWTLGASLEYRLANRLFAMETAILVADDGGTDHELAEFAFSLGYRIEL